MSRLEQAAAEFLRLPDLLIDVVDLLPIAVFIVDPAGEIRLVNRRAQLLTGHHRSELLGQPVEVLLPEALREVHARTHRPGFMEDPHERPMGLGRPLRLRRRDGTEIAVEVELQPIPAPGGCLVVVAVVRKLEREP